MSKNEFDLFMLLTSPRLSQDLDAMVHIGFHSFPPAAVTEQAILAVIFAPTLLEFSIKWISHLGARNIDVLGQPWKNVV